MKNDEAHEQLLNKLTIDCDIISLVPWVRMDGDRAHDSHEQLWSKLIMTVNSFDTSHAHREGAHVELIDHD
jgi:hypothetical protein